MEGLPKQRAEEMLESSWIKPMNCEWIHEWIDQGMACPYQFGHHDLSLVDQWEAQPRENPIEGWALPRGKSHQSSRAKLKSWRTGSPQVETSADFAPPLHYWMIPQVCLKMKYTGTPKNDMLPMATPWLQTICQGTIGGNCRYSHCQTASPFSSVRSLLPVKPPWNNQWYLDVHPT